MSLEKVATKLVSERVQRQGSRIIAAYPMLSMLKTTFPSLPEHSLKLALLRAVHSVGGATLWDKHGN